MALPAVLARKQAVAEGGELRLVIPSVTVLRVLAVTGIDRLIPSFASLGETLAEPAGATAGTRQAGVTDQLLKHS